MAQRADVTETRRNKGTETHFNDIVEGEDKMKRNANFPRDV